jgi:hypothetical protein
MSQGILIIIGLIAGLFLGALSNWIYDLLKGAGVFPDRPHYKHLLVIFLGSLPLILLVALPEFFDLSFLRFKRLDDPFVEVSQISPSPQNTVFVSDVERQIVVIVEYYLPDGYVSSNIQLGHLASYRPSESGNYVWKIIDQVPAKFGRHRADR